MAPVKIKYVVSFTSQDPKYPVENLVLEEGCRPWLCCPHDRSRQLKVELQLEQASHIGYVDVGNCGSAFLQIDVGRSSWPLNQPYLTLLPAASLMAPADAKLDKNRSGVRMFKEGDFLASALGEKWDRIRLLCSQPFNKHAQFGLTFVQIRTPAEAEGSKAGPLSSNSEASPGVTRSPWLSSAAICRTFFSEAPSSTEEEAALRSRLQQLEPSSSPGGRRPAYLSRPASMVLKAAFACKRAFPLGPSSSPPTSEGKGEGQARATQRPRTSGSKKKPCRRRAGVRTRQRRGSCSTVGRPAVASSVRSKPSNPEAQCRKRKRENMEKDKEAGKTVRAEDEGCPEEESEAVGMCPICAGGFPTCLLAAHASRCGEEDGEAGSSSPTSSSSSWGEPAEARIDCPICQFRFPASEVESHASSCGEPVEASGGSPSWLWVE